MQLCNSLNILWHCLSLGLECKLTFSSPVATAEFSKFAGVLSATLSLPTKEQASSNFLAVVTVCSDFGAQENKICHCFHFSPLYLLWSELPISAGSSKKQQSSRKASISASLTMPKPLTVWITINCGKFWKTWEYQTTWPASWEIYMQVRKQQLELDMEQQTGFNRKRSTSRLYIVTLLI